MPMANSSRVACRAEPEDSGLWKRLEMSGLKILTSLIGAVVLADAWSGVRRAEWPLAGSDDVAIRRDGDIKGAQLRIVDQAGPLLRRSR